MDGGVLLSVFQIWEQILVPISISLPDIKLNYKSLHFDFQVFLGGPARATLEIMMQIHMELTRTHPLHTYRHSWGIFYHMYWFIMYLSS